MPKYTTREIATLAARMPNINKPDAFGLFREIMSWKNEDIPLKAWAQIYNHFQPNKRPKFKTDTDWLWAAAGTEETRPYLHYIYVDRENKNIVTTDGHRLHMLPAPEDKLQGFYDKEGVHLGDEMMTFPDYRRVIPAPDESQPYHTWNRNTAVVDTLGYFTPTYILEDNIQVNKNYWDIAVQGLSEVTYQAYNGICTRIFFPDDPERVAVVMCMRTA